MADRISTSHYDDSLFARFFQDGRSDFPIINSVMLRLQDGEIFKGVVEGCEWLFVLHGSKFGELRMAGEKSQTLMDSFLSFVNMSADVPAYFHLYDSSALIEYCKSDNLRFRNRTRFRFAYKNGRNVTLNPTSCSKNVRVRSLEEVDDSMLNSSNLDNYLNFWSSYDNFVSKGFGAVVVDQNELPVSICYSAALDEVCAEVDVLTVDGKRGKGFGKMATMAFIEQSLNINVRPTWDCFADNYASIALAQNCGFVKYKSYQFVSIFDSGSHK